jgi:hypothetical protein
MPIAVAMVVPVKKLIIQRLAKQVWNGLCLRGGHSGNTAITMTRSSGYLELLIGQIPWPVVTEAERTSLSVHLPKKEITLLALLLDA